MLSRYLGSLFFTLIVVCAILSQLPFATRSQVRAGATIDETWVNEFTIEAGNNRTYRINDALKEELENSITFVGSGVARVKSVKVQIEPKDVSWEESKTKYTAPGAKMISHVSWDTPADAKDGAAGEIRIEFPKVPGGGSFDFHSGSYQKTSDGRWVFREIKAYRSAASVWLGRFAFVVTAGLPIALLLQGIWWAIQVNKEKKSRLAALAPADPKTLPRTFYSSPTAEWGAWTLTACITGFAGSLFASFIIIDGFESSSLDVFLYVIAALALVIGLIAVWSVRRSVVTVHVDDQAISIAKGRGEPRWETAKWTELAGPTVKTRTYKGNTVEWLELQFPDGRKRKIPQGLNDYAVLKEMLTTLYARDKQTAEPINC